MVFSSLIFTFFFLPLTVVLYYLSKNKYRNYILLVASLSFYAYGEPTFVFIMLGSIILNYFIAIFMSQIRIKENQIYEKALLCCAIFLNIGMLFIYKYLDFTIGIMNSIFKKNMPYKEIVLPIGISFFTFQALSYVIDVYRGNVEVQKNPFYLALYISFFPQLIAGPIVRYSTINEQIESRENSFEKFAYGFKRFLIGFCKKVLLANNLSVIVAEVSAMDCATTNAIILWISSICFSLQIYYDFSGYSDMAIGLGRIFGFDFEENFNYPYISKSITEFWSRWHISLGQWFRDYVYIPLGGSRVGTVRLIINIFVIWFLTGIWHGANMTYIVWGLGFFFVQLLEKLILKPDKNSNSVLRFVWQIITLFYINFSFVIFNASDIHSGIRYCLAMFGYYGNNFSINALAIRYIREYGCFILASVIFTTPICKYIKKKFECIKIGNMIEVVQPIVLSVLFLWSVSFILLGAHNPFIYFNF